MKKLPQGLWFDTKWEKQCEVAYYDSKSKCYRVEYRWRLGLGGRPRFWIGVEDFKAPRFTPPSAWDMVTEGIGL